MEKKYVSVEYFVLELLVRYLSGDSYDFRRYQILLTVTKNDHSLGAIFSLLCIAGMAGVQILLKMANKIKAEKNPQRFPIKNALVIISVKAFQRNRANRVSIRERFILGNWPHNCRS